MLCGRAFGLPNRYRDAKLANANPQESATNDKLRLTV